MLKVVDNFEDYELVHPRKMWPHEVKDFHKWLIQGGSKLLEHCLHLKFSGFEKGKRSPGGIPDFVGTISRKGKARKCPIEVQLGDADRSHHSQILTYSDNYGDDLGHPIWIAGYFEPRFVRNIISQNDDREFGREIFLVRVEVYENMKTGKLRPDLVNLIPPRSTIKMPEKKIKEADESDPKLKEQEFLIRLQEQSRIVLPKYFRARPISHGILKHRRASGINYIYDATSRHVRIGWAFVSKSGKTKEERHAIAAVKNRACLNYFLQFKKEIEARLGYELHHDDWRDLEFTLTKSISGTGYGIPVKDWDVGIIGLPHIMKHFIEVNEPYVDGLLKLPENKKRIKIPKRKLKNPRSQMSFPTI